MKRIPLLAVILAAISQMAVADEAAQPSKDEAAVRATADAFIKAFNRGDAKAVAALWTPNGTLADDRGEIFKGRETIENQYASFFKAQPGAKIEIAIQSIDFPTPGMAIEDGVATVVTKRGGPPTASRYTAVHVLQDGQWRMATVRESNVPIPSNYPRLEQFDWLIGKWEAKSEKTTIRTECPLDRQQELPSARLHRSPRWRDDFLGNANHRLGSAGGPGAVVVVRLVGRVRHGHVDAHSSKAGASPRPACWPTALQPRRKTC